VIRFVAFRHNGGDCSPKRTGPTARRANPAQGDVTSRLFPASMDERTAPAPVGHGTARARGAIGYDPPTEDIMRESRYGIGVDVALPYEQALERTAEELKKEGFGVLTTIDVKQTLKQKLDKDFRKYTILGACNPPLAFRAFEAELEIGLLLPCNVIVYEVDGGRSAVSAMAPIAGIGMVGGNPALEDVAKEADERLRRALTALESAAPVAGL
jgi:uncharacterized protein (DUF302 family)